MKQKTNKKILISILFIGLAIAFQSCLRDDDSVVKMPLKVIKIEGVNKNSLKIVFDKEVDKATAGRVDNYQINNLGAYLTPIKVTVGNKEVLIVFKENLMQVSNIWLRIKDVKAQDGATITVNQDYLDLSSKISFPPMWVSVKDLKIPIDKIISFNFSKEKATPIKVADLYSSNNWDLFFRLNNTMEIVSCSKMEGYPGKGFMCATTTASENVKKGDNYLKKPFKPGVAAKLNYPTGKDIWCERQGGNPNDKTKPFTILNKTFVFKTAKGKYGKMKIYSIYKGKTPNPVPDDFKNYYLSFDYVVQTDGTDNLDIPKQ